MIDYREWQEKFVSVSSLYLDPKNPRIPPSDEALSQRSLIAELVEHDNVLDLAKEIAENGYIPLESLIGLVDEDDGKTYVLEGNRRLAALKLLLNPEAGPDSLQKKIRALSKGVNPELIKKVRVLHAPTRDAAARLIMQKHTRQQIEKWSPLMQARFYRSLADGGLTAKQIAEQYGSTPGEVAEFLRTDSTYAWARHMDLPAQVKVIVDNPREFPVSTLQRILDTPKARELLGIEFDADGEIKGKVELEEFKKGFSRILTDIATDKINTRTVNKREDVEHYLDTIKGALPDTKRKGTFSGKDLNKKPGLPPKGKAAGRNAIVRPRQSTSIVPSGTKCRVKSARLNAIFEELRGLNLDKQTNSSAVMFRILVELAIGHYLDRTKKIEPLLAHAKKEGRGKEWYPTLRQMLDAVLKDESIEMPPLARKRLNKLVSDKNSSLSVDGLDAYVHNRFAPPTVSELRSYWDTFESLFNVVLDDSTGAQS